MSRSHLLLADSDASSLQIMEVSLRQAGFQVTGVTDGADALALARATPPDLVLSELALPGLDGFGLLAALRADPATAQIPVAFLTEETRVDLRMRALQLGVDDFLSKPIFIKEVVARARILLQRREQSQAAQADAAAELEGSLADMGLVDLVRSQRLQGRTAEVACLSHAGEAATFWVRDGRICDAAVGRHTGAAAFHRLLGWGEGQFRVRFGAHDRPERITVPAQALLLEGLARLDRISGLLDQLGGPDAVLQVDFVALFSRLGDVPDEANAVLRLVDGTRPVRRVLDESPTDDVQTLELITRLHAERIIVRRGGGFAGGLAAAAAAFAPPPAAPVPAAPIEAPEAVFVAGVAAATEPSSAEQNDGPSLSTALREAVADPAITDEALVPVGRDGRPLRGAALTRALARRRGDTDPGPVRPRSAEVTRPAEPVVAQPAPEPAPVVVAAVVAPAAPPVEAAPLPAEVPLAVPVAAEEAASDWAGPAVDPASDVTPPSAVDLAALLRGDGPTAPAHHDATNAIPVVRYPSRRGMRRQRLEAEAARLRAAAKDAKREPVVLVQEALRPGLRVPPELVAEVALPEPAAPPMKDPRAWPVPKSSSDPALAVTEPAPVRPGAPTPPPSEEVTDPGAPSPEKQADPVHAPPPAVHASPPILTPLAIVGPPAPKPVVPVPAPPPPAITLPPAPTPAEPVATIARTEPPALQREDDEDDLRALMRPSRGPARAVAAVVVLGLVATGAYVFWPAPSATPVAPVAVAAKEPPKPAPKPVAPVVAAPAPAVDAGTPAAPRVEAPPPAAPPVTAVAAAPKEPPPKPVAAPVAASAGADAFAAAVSAGEAAVRAESWSRAVAAFGKALKIKPDAMVLRELGKARYMNDQTAAARDSLLKATKLDPKDAEAWMYLGIVAQDLERDGEARKAYDRFLKLEPRNTARWKEIKAVRANLDR